MSSLRVPAEVRLAQDVVFAADAAYVRDQLAKGASAYRAAGQRLKDVKAKLPHGAWLPWLKQNFDLSPRQAQRYIALADLPANATHASYLDVMGHQGTPSAWDMIRVGHALAAEADRMIAAALRDGFNEMGKAAWLAQCKKNWGWSRAEAYRKLRGSHQDCGGRR